MGLDLQIYKQRVKHLLFDHESELTDCKAEAETAIKLAQDDHRANENNLKLDKRGKRRPSRLLTNYASKFLCSRYFLM